MRLVLFRGPLQEPPACPTCGVGVIEGVADTDSGRAWHLEHMPDEVQAAWDAAIPTVFRFARDLLD